VIAPDANLLIYAYSPDSPFRAQSRAWLEHVFSSPEPVGIPILSIYAFLRITTHPKALTGPTPQAAVERAMDTVDSWLTLPHVRILYPGDRHWQILHQLSQSTRLTGNLITDAAIAAIAIEYGATIHSNDRDFTRFPNLRWHNPLEP
jgi:toxin-antitoxin system PIN domain toxin